MQVLKRFVRFCHGSIAFYGDGGDRHDVDAIRWIGDSPSPSARPHEIILAEKSADGQWTVHDVNALADMAVRLAEAIAPLQEENKVGILY